MMRRLMTMGIMLLMLSSCYYFNQVVDDIKESNVATRTSKKDGGGAYKNDKYKEGVYKAIDDIVKRPVNKKVQFKGIELIIPENTEINSELRTLLDLKTGYGLPIGFSATSGCVKKVVEGKVYSLWYNDYISGVNEIGKKIEKVNGFTYTCK